MDHKLILKDIRAKKLEKIYFFHGEEPFFIDELTREIIHHALEEHERDFNQTVIYGKDAELLSLLSELKNYPMLGTRKLVVLKEAQDFKKIDELDTYFESPSDTTIFVVNYKFKTYDARKKLLKLATKNGVIYKSDKLKDYQLNDWIQSYIKQAGYSITSKACMLLAEFLGADLGRIVKEVEKLAILLEKGTAINEIHIEENIGISKDYNIFELTNALGERDVVKVFKIIDYFERNPKATDIVQVVSMVFKYYTQLLRIHFLPNKSKEAIAAALKVPPYGASILLHATKNNPPKKIAINIAILYEYDLKSKGVGNTGAFKSGDLMKEMVYRLLH
jgi:DNA polymerase-3 subunit delta